MTIKAIAAHSPSGKFEPFQYDPGALGPDEIEIDVTACGICHSDLSMLKNDWQMTTYPFVPGHEVAGTVARLGEGVTHLELGQKVGLGWFAGSCGHCEQCLSGNQNLCAAGVGTIVGRHGGFANKVRAQAVHAVALPGAIDLLKAGPLFCGGITVFNPIVLNGVSPTDRVGVVGIGGLGHLALQFLNAWGCEVTAFSTSPAKEPEARALGAHHFVDTRESDALANLAGSFDVILVTVNVALDWDAYIAALRPKGKLHLVGAAPSVSAQVFPLIAAQRSIGASPVGSPATIATMLDFAARHDIAPKTETFPMSEAGAAFEKLEREQPPHRLVLECDL